MALRKSLETKILAAIEASPFTAIDFDVATGGKPGTPILRIDFRHHPSYTLEVFERLNNEIHVEISPGAHKLRERHLISSLGDIPDEVKQWTRHIRDELRTTVPVYAELDALREKVDRHIEEHVSNPNEPFAVHEAAELAQKLDEMIARFVEMEARHELTEQELKRLQQEVTSLKVNVESYPKGTWYRTAAAKLWDVTSKVASSKESRQVLADSARKALGM
jgi:hypothetical protein